MITPLDIQNKEFTRGVRGYKEEEVDSFLDLVTLDFEKLIQENKRLKENLKTLTSEVERYRGSEGSILETLEAAKALMRDISASAEKRAEILLKNAELDAERIQREARESVERLTEESKSLKNRWGGFKTRYRNLLETELERFDDLTAEIFEEADLEELKTLTDVKTADQRAASVKYAESNDQVTAKTLTNFRIGDNA